MSSSLPDDINALKRLLAEQEALNRALLEKLNEREREIDHLQAQLDKLRRMNFGSRSEKGHCCKVSDEAAFCLIQRPYISKTLLTRRISPRGSP